MNPIDQLINQIGEKLVKKNYSLVTAESCTGGGIAFYFTMNSQYSCILERGYVVYSLAAKQELLNITPYSLQTFGIVSKEIALEMAEKALHNSKAQISVAITGVDEAAENDKDVSGIIWVACANVEKKKTVKKIEIKGNRKSFCQQAILESLQVLLDFS